METLNPHTERNFVQFGKTESVLNKGATILFNINYGKNRNIMECCQILRDYARFIEQVRKFLKTIPVNEAVEAAVSYCIEHDILRNFLMKTEQR